MFLNFHIYNYTFLYIKMIYLTSGEFDIDANSPLNKYYKRNNYEETYTTFSYFIHTFSICRL